MPTKILAKLENINKELQHKYCNNKKMTMKQTKKQNKKQWWKMMMKMKILEENNNEDVEGEQ